MAINEKAMTINWGFTSLEYVVPKKELKTIGRPIARTIRRLTAPLRWWRMTERSDVARTWTEVIP